MMRRLGILLFSLFLLLRAVEAPGQGLRFHGLETTIGERTSLDLFPWLRPVCRDSLVLRLEARVDSDQYGLGYICRIETVPGREAPVINIVHDRVGDSRYLRIIWEGQRFVSNLPIPISDLPVDRWFSLNIRLDLLRDSLFTDVDGRWKMAGAIPLPDVIRPRIVFGRSHELTEIIPMSLRNLRMRERKWNWSFPLDEVWGEKAACHGLPLRAKVTNPDWLAQDAAHWHPIFSNTSETYQSIGYDARTHRLWCFHTDSIRFVTLPQESRQAYRFNEPCPIHSTLGTSFIGPRDGALYAYEMFYDSARQDAGTPSFARLRPDMTWEALSCESFDYQFHHHNEWADSLRNRLLVFGGYAFRKYNGKFFSFSLDSLGWRELPPVRGEALWPRFLGAMGYDKAADRLLFFGGKGNESGEQIVGPQYLYSLHSVDLKTLECRKRWQIPWPEENIVTGRNMVVDGTGHFYILGYCEAYTQTQLRLYRFSIEDGAWERLADDIPFYSDRISCMANLYFDPDRAKLVATIEESEDDVRSHVAAYVLDYPPRADIAPEGRRRFLPPFLSAILILLLLTGSILIPRWRARRKAALFRQPLPPEEEVSRPSSVFLFGGVVMRDRKGNDITPQFTGKLRQLFCIVLQRGSAGISSRHLSSILWPDRPEEETKNVRGVTVNKLRKLLSQMDGISLVSREKRFYLETAKPFWCDYLRFQEILDMRHPDMDRLVRILSRGRFLTEETDPVYDKLKESVESRVEPIMTAEMQRRFQLKHYSVCLTCADVIFGIDPLNEDALSCSVRSLLRMERSEEAKALYNRFISRYSRDYGEAYPYSYESLTGSSTQQTT